MIIAVSRQSKTLNQSSLYAEWRLPTTIVQLWNSDELSGKCYVQCSPAQKFLDCKYITFALNDANDDRNRDVIPVKSNDKTKTCKSNEIHNMRFEIMIWGNFIAGTIYLLHMGITKPIWIIADLIQSHSQTQWREEKKKKTK